MLTHVVYRCNRFLLNLAQPFGDLYIKNVQAHGDYFFYVIIIVVIICSCNEIVTRFEVSIRFQLYIITVDTGTYSADVYI